jgi:hypothetical protein
VTAAVRDARPPLAVIRVLNPIMRFVLRTPLGGIVRPFALLEFSGRRSGRRYRVPVGWHESDGGPVVLTPAPWRTNFTGGARTTAHYRGRRYEMTGTLVTDPAAVAAVLQSMFVSGTSPRRMGLDVPPGHVMTASDVALLERAMIRLQPAPPARATPPD